MNFFGGNMFNKHEGNNCTCDLIWLIFLIQIICGCGFGNNCGHERDCGCQDKGGCENIILLLLLLSCCGCGF